MSFESDDETLSEFVRLEQKIINGELSATNNAASSSDDDDIEEQATLILEYKAALENLQKKLQKIKKEKAEIKKEKNLLKKERNELARERSEFESSKIMQSAGEDTRYESLEKKFNKLKDKFDAEKEQWKGEKTKLLVEIEVLKTQLDETKKLLLSRGEASANKPVSSTKSLTLEDDEIEQLNHTEIAPSPTKGKVEKDQTFSPVIKVNNVSILKKGKKGDESYEISNIEGSIEKSAIGSDSFVKIRQGVNPRVYFDGEITPDEKPKFVNRKNDRELNLSNTIKVADNMLSGGLRISTKPRKNIGNDHVDGIFSSSYSAGESLEFSSDHPRIKNMNETKGYNKMFGKQIVVSPKRDKNGVPIYTLSENAKQFAMSQKPQTFRAPIPNVFSDETDNESERPKTPVYKITSKESVRSDYSGKSYNSASPRLSPSPSKTSMETYFNKSIQARRSCLTVNYNLNIPPKPKNGQVVNMRSDGRMTMRYADGSISITFPNNTIKHKTREAIYVYYPSGDVNITFRDGVSAYKYHENNTVELKLPDGSIYFEFCTGQKERHFPSGDKAVSFPNGEYKYIYANGDFDLFLPGGSISRCINGNIVPI